MKREDFEVDHYVPVGVVAIDGFSGLNEKLIATIYPINGSTADKVSCFLEDAEFSLENQYQTPFENADPMGKMPTLMGMVQSGQALAQAGGLLGAIGAVIPDGLESELAGLQGKTSFTKLNSQQIYLSSSSVKITGTLVLTAWTDAKKEVEDKLRLLQSWAVPVFLSDNAGVVNVAQGMKENGVVDGGLNGVFSGTIPPRVALAYGGKTYSPLVIESISAPITAPMNAKGDRIAVKAQINLMTMQAWDRRDVNSLYGISAK